MNGFNLSGWALENRSVVAYLMLLSVVAGVLAFVKLGRNEDPAFTIRTMVVAAGWPGATLDETTLQVTERIERKLQEVPGLDFMQSYTQPGRTTVFINLLGSVSAAQTAATWQRVRNDVNDVWRTLPSGSVGPFINDRFGDVFGIIYGFTADGFTHRELRDHVERIRSELLHVPDVTKIDILGAQDEVIFVEFSMQELASLGVDRQALLAAIRTQNDVRPAGVIETGDERISLRVTGAFQSEQDLLDINFVAGGRMIRLSDIATVRRGYSDPPQPMFRVDGQPAIGLGIAMRDGGDVLALGDNIDAALTRIRADLPLGIEPHLVANQPATVEIAIGEFMESLWQAVLIILGMSFLSLGVRPGLVVALAIPLTLAIVFAIMLPLGIDMQRISLGALIIALALMVDDAMTTTDATLTRLAAGDTKAEASMFAFRTYALSMLAGTLVTIAGFVPIGFARSSAGEYCFTLFAVVTIALLVSWLVAVIFAPLLSLAILKVPEPGPPPEMPRVVRWYRGFLSAALRARWLTIAVTLGLFVGSLLLLPLIPRQFFPASDRPELLVDLNLPQNASIFAADTLSARFDAILKDDPDVDRWSTWVGQGAIRFYLPLDVQLANPFFAQAVIVATDLEARDRLHAKLEQTLAEDFPGVVARVSPLELGPPVGWPIQYRVSGPDPAVVRSIALDLAGVVAASPATLRTNFDWVEPTREVRIRVDQNEARLLGLSSEALAGVLSTVITGSPVTQVRDDIYLVDVLARATDEQRVSIGTLPTLQVPLPNGRTVALGQFASFEFAQDFPLIWRRGRMPTLTVQADAAPGRLPAEVVAGLEEPIEQLRQGLPQGYTVDLGGTVEESAASQVSVVQVIPIMLLLMLTILMFELRKFSLLFIALSVAPLGLIGVVGALLPSGQPLGFVAILGCLALLGMITKNAVILIGQIETERAAGKSVFDAALDAGSTRFRPIMLTALSTVFGMIPIAPTVFWGPMAFAIMGGLLAGTLLTLVFLPALYVAWYGDDRARAPADAAAPVPSATA